MRSALRAAVVLLVALGVALSLAVPATANSRYERDRRGDANKRVDITAVRAVYGEQQFTFNWKVPGLFTSGVATVYIYEAGKKPGFPERFVQVKRAPNGTINTKYVVRRRNGSNEPCKVKGKWNQRSGIITAKVASRCVRVRKVRLQFIMYSGRVDSIDFAGLARVRRG